MNDADQFTPMWASPPGHTIMTRLDELGVDQETFAEWLDAPQEVVVGLLDGREPITVELARRLSSTVGASVQFWVNRDCQYRDSLVRVETDGWLSELPVDDMAKFGWIRAVQDRPTKAREALDFFGVEDLVAWKSEYEPLLFRSHMRISDSVRSSAPAVAAWLRKATVEASLVETASWNAEVLSSSLTEMRALTRVKDPDVFLPRLRELLASAGVALAVVPSMPGCPASGAALRLSPERAMLIVSGRFLADDQFWFTVFHEVGHLLLHESDELVLDNPGGEDDDASVKEQEANSFAADALLPEDVRATVPPGKLTYRDVVGVARRAGVSAGVVVGQLQFERRIGFEQLNKAKRRYRWNGSSLETA